MEFSRQQNWSGLPFPSPGDLPNPGIEPKSLVSPALSGGFLTTVPPGKPIQVVSVSFFFFFFTLIEKFLFSVNYFQLVYCLFFLFFLVLFILLYNIVLVLPYIDMNPPWPRGMGWGGKWEGGICVLITCTLFFLRLLYFLAWQYVLVSSCTFLNQPYN